VVFNLGQIPDYLRVETTKYKGDVAEEIALRYLQRMNYKCKPYSEVSSDFVVSDSSYTYRIVDKSFFDAEIKKNEDHLKRFKKSLEKYRSKVPPKGLRWEGSLTWQEFRERQLEYGEWHIKNVEEQIIELKNRERRIKKTWGEHVENLKRYINWLEKYKHHPKYPDFIALKEDKVYVIEVKCLTKGKRAFFSKYQKKALEKSCDYGFTPMLLVVPIDINIEIGKPEITVLSDSNSSAKSL